MIKILFVDNNNKDLVLYTSAIFHSILHDYNMQNRFIIKQATLLEDNHATPIKEELALFAQSKGITIQDSNLHSLFDNSTLLEFDYLISLNKRTYEKLLSFAHPDLHYNIDTLDSYSHYYHGKEITDILSYDSEYLENVFTILNSNLHDLIYHITKDKK